MAASCSKFTYPLTFFSRWTLWALYPQGTLVWGGGEEHMLIDGFKYSCLTKHAVKINTYFID